MIKSVFNVSLDSYGMTQRDFLSYYKYRESYKIILKNLRYLLNLREIYNNEESK